MLRVFYSNDFKGFYPVGTAAVVVAKNEREARKLLEAAHPMAKKGATLVELKLTKAQAVILLDGNY